jgi:hypothetical protein
MAKTSKRTRTKTLNSTADVERNARLPAPAKKREGSGKGAKKTRVTFRHADGRHTVRQFDVVRDCCAMWDAILSSAPSGSMLTTEDGGIVVTEPVNTPAYWFRDPAANAGQPFWQPV